MIGQFMPIPLPPRVDGGVWELFASTTASTYPAALQDGDVAIILKALGVKATDSGYTPSATPFNTPTGATAIIASLYGSGSGYYSSGDHYWTNTAAAGAFWRVVSAAMSGTAIGGSGVGLCLIYRATKPGSPAPSLLGSAGTDLTYSTTAPFASEPKSPVLACFLSMGITDPGARSPAAVTAPTHSFDGVAPEETYLVSATYNLARIRFSVLKQALKADVALACTAITNAATRRHQPFNIRK